MRQDEIGRQREKRILDPNSAHTRPGGENSERKCKKIQKTKKQLSGDIFSQNGMRLDEIGREGDKRNLNLNSTHTRPGGANSEKKQQKISKNQRPTFRNIFSQIGDETGREREKRILHLNSSHTRPGGENSEKKQQKHLKN